MFSRPVLQSFIAEQNMVGMGIGLAAKATSRSSPLFAAFLTRATTRSAWPAYSFSNIKLCGSHVGVSIGEDGPSQMGLEDLAMFRPIPGCVVLYPSDAVSSEACVAAVAAHKGMCYIRTSRPATPILYPANEAFPIGGSKVLRRSEGDAVTVIAAGVTVHEALKAWDLLKKEGIGLRVVDAYSVEPLDKSTILRRGRRNRLPGHSRRRPFCRRRPGEAVAQALAGKAALIHLCISELPAPGSRTSSWKGSASARRASPPRQGSLPAVENDLSPRLSSGSGGPRSGLAWRLLQHARRFGDSGRIAPRDGDHDF